MKNSGLAWIAGGLLMLGAGLGMALLTLPTAVEPPPVSQASRAPGGDPSDAVHRVLLAGKPTVAEFGANACAACREMKTVLAALRQTHGDRIGIVNVDLIAQKEVNYIQRYRIQLMPTQVFFDSQGRETSRHMGKITGEEILARLQVAAPSGGPQ